MLLGGALAGKFWPYAFDLYLRIHNALPFQGTNDSPISHCTKHQDDFTNLPTFGCHAWVRPPRKRSAKLALHAKRGIFLGYPPDTKKNVIWLDLETRRVKNAVHVGFGERMSDVHPAPPNIEHLRRSQGANIPAESDEIPALPLISTSNPCLCLSTKTIKLSSDSPSFGLDIARCPICCQPYISDMGPGSLASTLCSSQQSRTKRKYLGAFILSVNNVPTYTPAKVQAAFDYIRSDSTATSFTIRLAPETLPSANSRADSENLLLGVDQLRAIHALRAEILGSDLTAEPVSDDHLELLLHALSSTTGSAAERALGSFTCRKIRNLETWPIWKGAEGT